MAGKTVIQTQSAIEFAATMDEAYSRKGIETRITNQKGVGTMTELELAKMKERSDEARAKARELQGYNEVLAEVRSEAEAAEVTAAIIRGSNLTQKEIAKRMQVSQPFISQLKNGSAVTLPTLFRLARACGATLKISACF